MYIPLSIFRENFYMRKQFFQSSFSVIFLIKNCYFEELQIKSMS